MKGYGEECADAFGKNCIGAEERRLAWWGGRTKFSKLANFLELGTREAGFALRLEVRGGKDGGI